MYAIVQDGGHQYRVEPGMVCRIQLKDTPAGETFTFDQVSLVGGDGVKIGQPFLSGATVTATVLGLAKGPKVVSRQFRRRKDSRCKVGHRQRYTELRIDSINA
ncbi:MAG: 50S ribosomal protein L21 [Planctomycetota bacterium]